MIPHLDPHLTLPCNPLHPQNRIIYVFHQFCKILSSYLTRAKSSTSWVPLLSEGSGEQSASNLIQVVGRIQFTMAVGLRSPFPCERLARGHSLLLETACIPLHMGPPASNRQWHIKSFSCFLFCPQPEKTLPISLGQLPWDFHYFCKIPSEQYLGSD